MTGGEEEKIMQRLDKILSEAGIASRKDLRQMIRAGRVTADGQTVLEPDAKFDETAVSVTVDGEPVGKKRKIILMLNKPAGYITATEDARQPTVMELIPEEYRRFFVVPVGRLDKETEGLLLFTNDGDLIHRLTSPKTEVWKTYYAQHGGMVTPEDVRAFAVGMTLRDGLECLPAAVTCLGPGEAEIRVREGKYHQVRRMMASRGMKVNYLRRIKEGNLELGDLPLGQVREITEDMI